MNSPKTPKNFERTDYKLIKLNIQKLYKIKSNDKTNSNVENDITATVNVKLFEQIYMFGNRYKLY